MRYWVLSLLAAVVTTGSAVAVNLATDWKRNVWAWVAVGMLTLVGTAMTVWSRKRDLVEDSQRLEADGTQNEATGPVQGPLVQAGGIDGAVTMTDSSRKVTQAAFGFGNSIVQQAGGDIHNDGEKRPGS